ncbi:MAG: XTP/dITP diphosphatase [Candidatus Micrarchaeia archaeon]|jgi:XTP/dITP diphosphohydrolase
MIVNFVTGNKNKFEEAKRILSQFGIGVKQISIKIIEPKDNDIKEVSRIKATQAFEKLNTTLFVEDAGLFIEALNGFPGAYSAFVYRTIGCEGILKLMEKEEARDAYFASSIAFISHSLKEPLIFYEEVTGKIAKEKRGVSGFGFDPIFIPNGYSKTFAELGEEKDKVSHRSKALFKFAQFLLGISKN